MRVPFRLVDVFADRPLAGNQLCVVPDPGDMDEATMMALAAEIGFSETTFVTAASGSRYSMRIFTPTHELPFAGHPTLGTAYVLAHDGRITTPAIQTVAAGEFSVEVSLDERFAAVQQLPPVFEKEVEDLRLVAEAAGLSPRDLHPEWKPQVVGTGLPYLIVPTLSESAVRYAVRNESVIGHLLNAVDASGYYLFAVGETPGTAKARMFDHDLGIQEDAATGSAAGPLGAYLAARGAGGLPGQLAISQGEELGRPSTLHVRAEADGDSFRVTVGGGVYLVGEGAFEL